MLTLPTFPKTLGVARAWLGDSLRFGRTQVVARKMRAVRPTRLRNIPRWSLVWTSKCFLQSPAVCSVRRYSRAGQRCQLRRRSDCICPRCSWCVLCGHSKSSDWTVAQKPLPTCGRFILPIGSPNPCFSPREFLFRPNLIGVRLGKLIHRPRDL